MAAITGMRGNLSHGFTLLELLVAMAVAAILLGVGVPSFLQTVKSGRISSEATCLNLALFSARSEAVRRSSDVTVCPYETANSCGTDWNKGVLVFTEGAGVDATADLETAVVDADSTIIRSCPPVHEDNSMLAVASSNRSVGTAQKRKFIRYSRQGDSNWEPGYFAVCDDRTADRWKALNIGISGDIRSARTHADMDSLVDAFGRKIASCN